MRLTAYVIGSVLTSVLIGVAIIAGLKATEAFTPHHSTTTPIFNISVGVLILLSAAWLHSERSANVRRRTAERRARHKALKQAKRGDKPSRSAQILSKGSVGLIATLGVAMHLPGLLYLAALGDIAHANVSTSRALILLVMFNLVMLAPIELPLLGYIVAPQPTQETIKSVDAFIHRRRRRGLLLASAVAGGYLIVTGIAGLVG